MFSYCLNNSVNYVDSTGKNAAVLPLAIAPISWLPLVDGPLPIADIILGAAILVVCATAATSQDSTFEITYDEPKVTYNSPSPNNNDDDDDDDDDYYYDDSNFGGRQKMGKGKGKMPGNNQTQNKQFKDATKGILNKDQQRMLHNEITGEGLGFHDIVDAAKNLWFFFVGLFTTDE